MTSSSPYDVIKLVIFAIFAFFLPFFHFDVSVTSTIFDIDQQTNTHFEVSRLESNFIIVKTLSYYVIITL